jgi:hypothetical protein
MVGGRYDTVSVENALAWSPTVTLHCSPAPAPSLVTHSTAVWPTTTLQFTAAHTIPRPEYIDVTFGVPSGPKFVPVTRTFVPPTVGIAARSCEPGTDDSDVIDGAAYDAAADSGDNALVWLPTDTTQRWSRPKPSPLRHDIRRCGTSTTQLPARNFVPSTPP